MPTGTPSPDSHGPVQPTGLPEDTPISGANLGEVPSLGVGIGAPAMGLEATSRLLAHLPVDSGMAFVVVQQLDPAHEAEQIERLGKATRLPVRAATHGLTLAPDTVYLIQPDTSLAVVGGVLQLEPRDRGRGPQPRIDPIVQSPAEDWRASVPGVILLGAGSDGTPVAEASATVEPGARLPSHRETEEGRRKARDELERRVCERTAELVAANVSLRQQLAEHQDILRRFAAAEEEERRRISREIHDEVGQYLTALSLELRRLGDSLPDDPPTRRRLERLQQMAGETGREVQRFAIEFRPLALDDVGLAPTLRNDLDEWSSRTGIPVDFHASGLAPASRPPSEAETAIYRVAREALTNIAKHAGASRVSVILEAKAGGLALIVENDGPGFDVEAASRHPGGAPRLGLIGMRERMAMIGGTLTIESSPAGPTTLFARVPTAGTEEPGPHG